jgi:hypothetical protein
VVSREYCIFAENFRIMETSTRPTTATTGVSSADALWTLIQKQSKNTRRAIAERLLISDLEMGEQLLLKASIERGWQQVKSMQQTGCHSGTLQDLINELD